MSKKVFAALSFSLLLAACNTQADVTLDEQDAADATIEDASADVVVEDTTSADAAESSSAESSDSSSSAEAAVEADAMIEVTQ